MRLCVYFRNSNLCHGKVQQQKMQQQSIFWILLTIKVQTHCLKTDLLMEGIGSFNSGTSAITFLVQSSSSLLGGLSRPTVACRMMSEWLIMSFSALFIRASPFFRHSFTEEGTTKLSLFESDSRLSFTSQLALGTDEAREVSSVPSAFCIGWNQIQRGYLI